MFNKLQLRRFCDEQRVYFINMFVELVIQRTYTVSVSFFSNKGAKRKWRDIDTYQHVNTFYCC
ncbi:hypothetical protein EMIT07CA2_10759 [Brevibacillus sp. IT-7CA2]